MSPLNSPLEVGMRALVLLSESFPEPLDLAQLVYLDHAMLHSSELNGPPSLHPTLPAGPGELAMKRHLIEQGMIVLLRAGLADVQATEDGLVYRATEDGPGFVEILESPYSGELKHRAEWIIGAHGLPHMDVREATQAITSRWAHEFSGDLPLPGSENA
ncbi:ABC-three component system middle component 2 [Streptomyces sp. NPDC052236]|uniref:ABC-three component system middle component 2 n=1 Tax=Streptomyces sp. NPDC052236 TaxID=3365686 RepID=UPI0037D6E382